MTRNPVACNENSSNDPESRDPMAKTTSGWLETDSYPLAPRKKVHILLISNEELA